MSFLFDRLRLRTTRAKLPKPRPLGEVPTVPESEVVTRRDIRDLSPEEQNRVCNAIEKMMEPGWAASPANNIGSYSPDSSPSEFFRLARYHGWDKSYCVHGRETFPGWHRAYLVDFERTLQAADRALGGDGRIALPYWGWERGFVNGQLLPAIIRERFSKMKPGLIPDTATGSQLGPDKDYKLVNNDQLLANGMKNMKIDDQVRRALSQWEHPRAASTHSDNPDSVETPHNALHVLAGWPLTSVSFAAFHPLFYLHHANVDRLYEGYLKKDMANAGDGDNAPWVEFDQGLYGTELRPFRHPATGEWFLPKHTFKTRAIGYVYDNLPPIPPQQLREPPTLARFEDINPMTLAGRSIALHVFVVPAEEEEGFEPPGTVEEYDGAPQYGGLTGVFGSKLGICENCVTRDPIDVEVDVTDCLRRQGLTKHTARLLVVAVDMNEDEVVSREEVGIPQPKLVGPFFADKSLMLSRGEGVPESVLEAGEVVQLQRYLRKYGWYGGQADGFFGPATEEAVRSFQRFYGLEVDGVAGPATRSLMMMARMDDKEDEVDTDDVATFATGSVVRWWAGGCPGYLDLEAVRDEVAEALAEWGTAVPLSFVEVGSPEEANLVLSWGNRSRDNMFKFDGPGGALAYTAAAGPAACGGGGSPAVMSITLDAAEHWLLQAAPPTPGGFYLQPVVLHEIGHALGLTHSSSPDDVMSPFYVADRLTLSDGDRDRVGGIYPLQEAMEKLFRVLDLDRDGLLSREEFLAAMCGRGAKTTPVERSDAEALFSEADVEGAGALGLQQFVVLMARLYFE